MHKLLKPDEDWITQPDGSVHITVLDSETTGLDPEKDELIGLGLLCVRVDREHGRVLGVVGTAFEWREPAAYSDAAQAITGIPAERLAGRRFDHRKIEVLLGQTDMVVAHNAAFEWPLVARHFPKLRELRWACSLSDIDWREGQGIAKPTIAGLLQAYAMGPTEPGPEGDCHALVRILAQPLPKSPETGFRRLIEAAARVTVVCELPDAPTEAQAGLNALGFESSGNLWIRHCEDAEAALILEMKVVDLSVDNPAFAHLKMWQVDATTCHASEIYGTS